MRKSENKGKCDTFSEKILKKLWTALTHGRLDGAIGEANSGKLLGQHIDNVVGTFDFHFHIHRIAARAGEERIYAGRRLIGGCGERFLIEWVQKRESIGQPSYFEIIHPEIRMP